MHSDTGKNSAQAVLAIYLRMSQTIFLEDVFLQQVQME
jgi:hypothetical protein